MAEQFYFYVLLCQDNSLYAGYTTDLTSRVATHNEGKGAKYTQSRRPVNLIYSEVFETKSEALKREYWFKKVLRTRSKKVAFLASQGIEVASKK